MLKLSFLHLFQPAKPKIKHDWYQTDTLVVVTILLKNAPSDKVKVNYGDKSVSIVFNHYV